MQHLNSIFRLSKAFYTNSNALLYLKEQLIPKKVIFKLLYSNFDGIKRLRASDQLM